MFRAITRVAGLIWKTRANQFVLLLVEPRGWRGRGFCLFLLNLVLVGEGGVSVIVTVGLGSCCSGSGND